MAYSSCSGFFWEYLTRLRKSPRQHPAANGRGGACVTCRNRALGHRLHVEDQAIDAWGLRPTFFHPGFHLVCHSVHAHSVRTNDSEQLPCGNTEFNDAAVRVCGRSTTLDST